MENTLAYHDTTTMTVVKSFIVQAPGHFAHKPPLCRSNVCRSIVFRPKVEEPFYKIFQLLIIIPPITLMSFLFAIYTISIPGTEPLNLLRNKLERLPLSATSALQARLGAYH